MVRHAFIERSHFYIKVVAWVVLVQDNWGINEVASVCPETRRPTVITKHSILVRCESQDVFLVSKVFFSRSPYLKLCVFLSHLLFFLYIYS